jgi:ribosomal protein S18 acetylase RimI-like enzyme
MRGKDRATLFPKNYNMNRYTLLWLSATADMLPFYELVIQMGYTFSKEQYEEMLNEMIPHGYYQLVVLEGDEAVGLSGYWINTKLYSGRYVELDNVIVHRDHRSKGIGELLCREIERVARERDSQVAILDAFVENFRAHRFYYRQGYIARGYHYLKPLD